MANYWGLQNDGNIASNKVAAAVDQGGVADADKAGTLLVGPANAQDCGATYPVDITKYIEVSSNSFPSAFIGHCAAMNAAVTTADTLTVRRALTPVEATIDNTRLQLCAGRDSLAILLGGTCAQEVHTLSSNIYYVDQASDQSSTYPSLRRISLIAGPDFVNEEIIAGVEDMQIELGWGPGTETAVSGSPPANAQAVSYFQPSNAAITGNTGQIVAVRIWVLIRSESLDKSYIDTKIYEYGDRNKGSGSNTTNNLSAAGSAGKAYKPNDNYRRLLVSKTFFIRNVLGT